MTNHSNYNNDELLAGYLLDEIDQQSRREVEQWIVEDPVNARYFQNFKTILEASMKLKLELQIDEKEAWQRFVERTKMQGRKGKVVRLHTFYRIAAAVLIGISLVTLGYFTWDITDRSPVSLATASNTLSKALPDGSQVILNRNSTISYTRKLKGERRNVKLQGEAFFNVTPDAGKPFVVSVNGVIVTVVGTSFNVKGYEGKTEVVVETGRVRVDVKDQSRFLNPGERVIINKYDSIVSEEKVKGKLYNYYATMEFVCDNTPLWKLVEVLNEAYSVHIDIADPALRELPLTTTFHNEPLNNILNVISETFEIKVTRNGDKITIK